MKPIGKNRGRGIECHVSISKIFRYMQEGEDDYVI